MKTENVDLTCPSKAHDLRLECDVTTVPVVPEGDHDLILVFSLGFPVERVE